MNAWSVSRVWSMVTAGDQGACLKFVMTTGQGEMSADVPCHGCGYDLRAHPEEGKCPECGASVKESRRLAAVPRRPAWRESDPRWRRRMVAGTWVLVLLPLMEAMGALGWSQRVPVPRVFDFRGGVRSLDDTFLSFPGVYQSLVFCIGVVLLFSKERGRRRERLDWTRRWGVICSYVVLLLSAAEVLMITALVLAGISAVFQSMPLKYQPPVTQLFVQLSTSYLRWGAHPTNIGIAVMVAFSSIVIVLACAPLFDALRSSGSKRAAVILLAPLGLFSLIHGVQIARYWLGILGANEVFVYGMYFCPQLLVRPIAELAAGATVTGSVGAFFAEVAKWCIVLGIAVWLSVAQVGAWWQRKKRGRQRRLQTRVENPCHNFSSH